MSSTTHVWRMWIRTTPEELWRAITDPEWNGRYGYQAPAQYDLRPGGAYRCDATPEMASMGMPPRLIDGEVVEVDSPRRMVQTWHSLMEPRGEAEAPQRLTWEIHPEGEVCRLVLSHDLAGAPATAEMVSGEHPEAGGGWAWILNDLKTLLETGATLPR